jgi:hypothetical protein
LLGRYNAQGLGGRFENVVKNTVVTEKGLELQKNKEKKNCFSFEKEVSCGGLENSNPNPNTSTKPTPNPSTSTNNKDIEIWTRVTTGKEYIKIIVFKGKVVGAMLIGDTDLEEVFENLILNKLDVSALGVNILNPNIDLEDYFD